MTVRGLKGEQVSPPCADDMVVLIGEGTARWDYRIDGGRARSRRVFPGYLIGVPAGTRNFFASNASPLTHGVGLPPDLARQAVRDAGGGDFADFPRLAETGTTDEFARHLVLQMVEVAGKPGVANALLVDHLGVALALRLATLANPAFTPRQPARRLEFRELHRLEEFVRERLPGAAPLKDLAAVLGMTPFHFLRAFRLTTGETPHQWVLRRRAELALTMMKAQPPPSTGAVAAACGFADRSHLARVLRRMFPGTRFSSR